MKVFETFLARLSAAFCAFGHDYRKIDPCMWSFELGDESKSSAVFYHFESDGKELSPNEISAAFHDSKADEAALEKLLRCVPENLREFATKQFRIGQVSGWAKISDIYKNRTMPVLNRTKRERPMSLERRGERVLFAGPNASEEGIAALKKGAGF